ncbi:hypothetical protein ACSX1A_08400 [Pontibacter sp. MBLB2868]|uniref:hypothetical protein n=1 Tax=Pontibacter sp. MBLB2868 TaxID=3451555 RepID=UPI003F7519BB
MIHPYIINTLNGLILLIVGLIVYFTNPAKPPTDLIAPFLGILLLAATYHLRKHNRFVTHSVTALTLLAGFIEITRLNTETFDWNSQDLLQLLMGISCFIASAFYVGTFVRERRLRNNSIYKDDL